jgi:hypothetical protein
MLPDSAATGLRCRLRIESSLLVLSTRTYTLLELLGLLHVTLKANGLLFQPCVIGERPFVRRGSLFDICKLLIQWGLWARVREIAESIVHVTIAINSIRVTRRLE